MTLTGIEPATSRFVAQHFNHCATAVREFMCFVKITHKLGIYDPLDMTLCPWGLCFSTFQSESSKAPLWWSQIPQYRNRYCVRADGKQQGKRRFGLDLLSSMNLLGSITMSAKGDIVSRVSIMQYCIFPQDIMYTSVFVMILIAPHFLSTFQLYFEQYNSSVNNFKSV